MTLGEFQSTFNQLATNKRMKPRRLHAYEVGARIDKDPAIFSGNVGDTNQYDWKGAYSREIVTWFFMDTMQIVVIVGREQSL